MSKMAANFGKFFSGISKSKKKVSKSKIRDDDSEEESYEDPTNAFPTEAPSTIPVMPNYPPPRLNNNGKKRDDYADPYDSKENGVISPAPSCDPNSTDNYADPFDAKYNEQNKGLKNNNDNNSSDDDDGYDSPYENLKCNKNIDGNSDNYSSPWDMAKTIIKPDEYSDPWDTKNSSSPKSQDASFDDNYSEPYDKGKSTIIHEKQHDEEPVEEEMGEFSDKERRWIGLSVSKGTNKNISCPYSIQAKNLPLPTAPPPDAEDTQGDYDSPWDWKVKKIEKEFNDICRVGSKETQVNTKEISEPSSCKSDQVVNRKKSGGKSNEGFQKTDAASIKTEFSDRVDPTRPDHVIKREKSGGKSSENKYTDSPRRTEGSKKTEVSINTEVDLNDPAKAYEVDPTIPLENQGWFHGRIRRGDAEKLLDSEPDCSYLIRNSESSKIDYSLSIRNNGVTIHLKISCKDGKYILGVNSRPFDTIPEMIHFYSMNKLNIRGAEQAKLQYPVLQEAVYFTVMPGT